MFLALYSNGVGARSVMWKVWKLERKTAQGMPIGRTSDVHLVWGCLESMLKRGVTQRRKGAGMAMGCFASLLLCVILQWDFFNML